MPDSILALLCHGDDFCQAFDPRRRQQLVTHGGRAAAARPAALPE